MNRFAEWVTPQMLMIDMGANLRNRTHSRFPIYVAGTQVFKSSLILPMVYICRILESAARAMC